MARAFSRLQIWTVHSDNTITLNSTGLCIDVDNYAIAVRGRWQRVLPRLPPSRGGLRCV